MKIDEIPAGREMDALIAEKVMGWKPVPINHWLPEGKGRGDKPCLWLFNHHPQYGEQTRSMCDFRPSTDISAAWEVAERIYQKGAQFSVKIGRPGGWRAWVGLNVGSDAVAPTAPLAICRAALKTVLGRDEL